MVPPGNGCMLGIVGCHAGGGSWRCDGTFRPAARWARPGPWRLLVRQLPELEGSRPAWAAGLPTSKPKSDGIGRALQAPVELELLGRQN
jgi:hypothetical protein